MVVYDLNDLQVRKFVLLLVLLLLVGCVPPPPRPSVGLFATGQRTYLPLVQKPWTWPWLGFGKPYPDQTADLQGIRYVYFSWSPTCDDLSDPIGKLQRHIPEIRSWDDLNGQAVKSMLQSCNDGRPLFFLNEPEQLDQDNISPGAAADQFHSLIALGWRGPIYASGIDIEHGWWMDQFVQAYADKYQGGDRRIPQMAGSHIHFYVNLELFDLPNALNPPIDRLDDDDIQAALARQKVLLAEYIQHRRNEGNSTLIYVDEAGLLKSWHTDQVHDASFETYQDRVSYSLNAYDALFHTFPEVQGWMPYALYSGEADCTQGCIWTFAPSNLVNRDGKLTSVGTTWLSLARQTQ